MKTGFSLCTLSLQGKTCFHYRFFLVKKAYTGKTLFSLQGWVCSEIFVHTCIALLWICILYLYKCHIRLKCLKPEPCVVIIYKIWLQDWNHLAVRNLFSYQFKGSFLKEWGPVSDPNSVWNGELKLYKPSNMGMYLHKTYTLVYTGALYMMYFVFLCFLFRENWYIWKHIHR